MRRKVGVSAIKKRQNETSQYSKVGKALEEDKLAFVKDTLQKFKSQLTKFAENHKKRINSDPEFRQQFHSMCISTGVDPLASNKGFWADLLGIGDFYFELGVKIIEICVKTRLSNGGLISINEIYGILVSQSKKNTNISVDDILKATDKLTILGSGFKIINLSGNKMILSVPLEINNDHETILNIAQSNNSSFTLESAKKQTGWTEERLNLILKPMIQEGMVWLDDFKGYIYYYHILLYLLIYYYFFFIYILLLNGFLLS